MRVLFVGPAHPEAAWLFKALQESAHSLQRADDLRDGVFLATQEPFDAIVLMVLEGRFYSALLEFIGEIAAAGGGAAIVVLLGVASAQDRTKVLRAGADACLCQPYSFIELHERLQALLRIGVGRGRMGGSSSFSSVPNAAAGPSLDAATRELVFEGRRVAVTRREFLLLECLIRQVNAPVARDQLIRYAWPENEDVDPASVNLVVSRLRRKLSGELPGVRIETVSRFGYQFSVRNSDSPTGYASMTCS